MTKQLNTYFVKWKANPDNLNYTPSNNIPNICAAPQGSIPGHAYNEIKNPETFLNDTTWYPTARPYKHYRKTYNNAKGKIPTDTVNLPGSTIFRNSTKCVDENSKCGLNITSEYLTKENKKTMCKKNCYTEQSSARAKVRNGTTNGTKYCNEKKNYYSDTKGYLKAKCKSFADKSMTTQPVKDNNNDIIPYKYKDGCSLDDNKCNCGTTIYKPLNSEFSINTATDYGNYNTNKNKETIDKSASNLKNRWGSNTANASKYSSNKNAPITNKTFYQRPLKKYSSKKMLCFC